MSNTPRVGNSDLLCYIHDGSAVLRFRLCGHLSAGGVRDLENTWSTASSVIGGRRLLVDLSSVTGMDQAGRALLKSWQMEGASIAVTSSAAKERIESMLGRPVTLLEGKPRPHPWSRFR